ncbi:hypothetical protein AB1Y20_016523 [Prymnesium parvum]|uniref:Protein kinase domain-containing protein n=1 Tax=Prymnesium parvum TaxID=97485 RepID=A0AB34ID12_PRYPA
MEGNTEIWEGGGRRFRVEKVVGNGAFGIVWRALEEGGSGQLLAIKKVVLDRRYHNRELEMMKGLEHECVIKLHHHFEKPGRKRDETYLHLVMDYLPETIRSANLTYQKQRERLPVDHVRVYLYQTLKALEYIHSKSICHRDLKPDNLLVDPAALRLKLIDFGCAKVLVKGQPNVSYICSRYYRAPELLFGATEYSCAVDMWSAGTILVELLLGHLPFQGQDSTQQHIIEIMKLLGTPSERELRAMKATCVASDLPRLKMYPWERVFPSGTPSRAVDLAQKLLTYDPGERLTAAAALRHPFFESVDYILNGQPVPQSPDTNDAWYKELRMAFEAYAANRSEKVTELLPKLEAAVQQLASTSSSARGIVDEVGHFLRSYQELEDAAMRDLHAKILKSVRKEGAAPAAPREKRRQLDEVMQAGGAAPLVEQAAKAQQENAALRAQLAELEAEGEARPSTSRRRADAPAVVTHARSSMLDVRAEGGGGDA